MVIWKLHEWIERHERTVRAAVAVAVVVLLAGIFPLVYATGGIKYVFSHSMYLPILLAALVFGVRGGLLAGLVSGVVLGPYMPIDTVTGELQNTVNWLYRTLFFTLIGVFVGLASDGMRSYTRRLSWVATHDPESGLPNRMAMERAIADLGRAGAADHGSHFVILLELQNAKEIETTFGHEAVCRIIDQMAERIVHHFPEVTAVYRVHTSQLGIVYRDGDPGKLGGDDAALHRLTREPFSFGEIHLHGDIYIGAVAFDRLGQPPGFYLKKADGAASRAIADEFRTTVIVTPEVDTEVVHNIELLGQLKHALDQQQLTLHYQPKITLASGRVHGVEALMRWHHPTLGNIPPGKFIPRAEKSTLIDQLTDFALDQALAQQALWRRAGLGDIHTAVNVSTRNLTNHEFTHSAFDLLKRHQVPGRLLELEVTESSFMANIKQAIEVLTRLAEVRVVVSIDDFGTGYSSLQYLERLPVSVLKIDQSFIHSLPNNRDNRIIVETAVGLAHNLGMEVVAEGVETGEAYAFLGDIGCDLAQGYYISQALPSAEFSAWHRACDGSFKPG